MDENHQDKIGNKQIASEDKLWLPPLSSKDQQKLKRILSKGKKSTSNWTGFAGRTLWDWIQFFAVLAIPILVAAGTLYFTQQITQQQSQLNISASEQQHQTDIQIATDQQQEAALENYLDRMSDLLLNHELRQSKSGDEVRNVARTQTLTVLRRLDGSRRALLIQFLYQAQLVNTPNSVSDHNNPVIPLADADLSGIKFKLKEFQPIFRIEEDQLFKNTFSGCDTSLAGIHLRDADLSGANFFCINLSGADLSGAKLFEANLHGNLSHANLSEAGLCPEEIPQDVLPSNVCANIIYANLSKSNLNDVNFCREETSLDASPRNICANMIGANLSSTDLSYDQLSGANLSFVNLNKANLSYASLDNANLKGTILSQANLSGAYNLTQQQIDQVATCKGAILPKGLICHSNK